MFDILLAGMLGASIALDSNKPSLPPDGFYIGVSVEEEVFGPNKYFGIVYYTFKTRNECIYNLRNKISNKMKEYKVGEKRILLETFYECNDYSTTEGPPISDDEAVAVLKTIKE